MSPPSFSRWRAAAKAEIPLADTATHLSLALDAGGDRLDPASVARARTVLDKVSQRSLLTGGHTVVALAGATGSGKSSLFNAFVGSQVSTIGARRPTSSTATAAVWGDEPAGDLLDWLQVGKRHHVDAPVDAPVDARVDARVDATVDASVLLTKRAVQLTKRATAATARDEMLDGLVLLDLPDFDSRVLSHRAEADRVLDLVDVFVWVTDPQKYADARLHDDYVARLADRQAATVVVLNQADVLSEESVAVCRRDLSDLLVKDGIVGADVIATSARTGLGVPELRRRLGTVVQERTAAERRLVGDVRASARELQAEVGGAPDPAPEISARPDGPLVEALQRAAGIPTVLDAVERDFRREALSRTGWPFTRWARSLRPDPLRRLGLGARTKDEGRVQLDRQDVLAVLGRSSLPAPSPSARAAVTLATNDLGDTAGADLPRRWAEACTLAASPGGGDLADALDQAVVRTPLRARTPMWWTVAGWLQWLFAACAVVGFLWLVVLAVLGWLRLPEVGTPDLGPLPYPFLLFVGGLLVGLVLAALFGVAGRAGARRRRAVVARQLRSAIADVAQQRIVAPVQAVLDAHAATLEHLDAAVAGR